MNRKDMYIRDTKKKGDNYVGGVVTCWLFLFTYLILLLINI